MAAICARLIPSDDAPGATEAGVVNYIDLQLAGFYRKHRKAYRAGIAALDAAALLRHGAPFAGLPAKEQTSLLAGMERDPFFELVLAHAMQGFYGSPRHGGNRGGASWRMLGIPEPPVRGRLKYERS